jgi:hypothetical protein
VMLINRLRLFMGRTDTPAGDGRAIGAVGPLPLEEA